MAEAGDPPQQELLPGIDRLPPSCSQMESALSSIGVADAAKTARLLSRNEISLAPRPERKSKSNRKLVALNRAPERTNNIRIAEPLHPKPVAHDVSLQNLSVRGWFGKFFGFEFRFLNYRFSATPQQNTWLDVAVGWINGLRKLFAIVVFVVGIFWPQQIIEPNAPPIVAEATIGNGGLPPLPKSLKKAILKPKANTAPTAELNGFGRLMERLDQWLNDPSVGNQSRAKKKSAVR